MSDGPPASGGIDRRRALTLGGGALAAIAATLPVPDLGSGPTSRSDSRDGSSGRVDPGDPDPFERLHAAGITGEGVSVGILDPTGVDLGEESIRRSVADVASFSRTGSASGGAHGTAVATTVTNIAPDADLYLGTFDRPESFERAVAWCVARSVDLVLAPVAAHGVVPGARSLVTEAVRTATRAEIPVVAPTGNAALGHWTRPVARSSLRETGRLDRRIQISPLADGDQAGSRFVGWLTHDGPPELSLRLALYERTDRGTRNLLALSEAVGGGRGDRLVARLTGGDNWLEILIPSGLASDFGRPGIRVEVTTPTHRLAPAHPAGSVAFPAAMPAVIAVGALDVDARDGGTGAAPYSGRGPTADGQTGVDVVARPAPWDGPRGAGTSAAAARTAGIVALAAQYLTTTPARVARVLRETASDVGRKGRDSATGYGRIDADAVVQRARARSREEGKSGSG